MSPSKIKKAIGRVKDKTSISLARVSSNDSLPELDVAIVKATRHEEQPPEERHIRQILNLTTYSRAHVSACVATIAKRLNKTKNWVVALKTLMLLQRLMSEGDRAYEQEIFFSTRRGTRFLNMSDFRDSSAKLMNAWDYSAFVRSYALYLDEQLEYRMQGRRGKRSAYGYSLEEEEGGGGGPPANARTEDMTTPVSEMKNERIFSRTHHLILLLDRFLACRPTGAARHNRIVAMALNPIVKESFHLCYDIAQVMGIVTERFMQLQVGDMVRVHDIFSHVAKLYEEVSSFHEWCKTVGIAPTSEYPDIERIPGKKLDMMDEYIREKSTLLSSRRLRNGETIPDEDMNGIKALPAPEDCLKVIEVENKKAEEEEYDLLNLDESEDVNPRREDADQGQELALALLDGNSGTAAPTSTFTTWEAFEGKPGDWETALVESASHFMSKQTVGFDALMLDGLYQAQASSATMLALPAPASSEQLMWQQFTRDGMQGEVGLAKVQVQQQQASCHYNSGG